MAYQQRRVVMSFKARGSDDEGCVGSLSADIPLNPDIQIRFYTYSQDTLSIRVVSRFTAHLDGRPQTIQSAELAIVPRTRNKVNEITSIKLHSKGDANVPDIPGRLSSGEYTVEFNWSHCIECSFKGCFGTGWETNPTLKPEVRRIWKGLKSLRQGGVVCIWIQHVGSNAAFFPRFVQEVELADVPWTRYRSNNIPPSTHWVEFKDRLPPPPTKPDSKGMPVIIRENAVERFLDLHTYEVYLAVGVKRDDDYQTSQLRVFEGAMHKVEIKALQGLAYGYMYGLVKVHPYTKSTGKMPGSGTSFQIDWSMPGQTSEDERNPVWQGTVIQKPYWVPHDIDFVMVTRQPIGGQLPSGSGGDANLSAVFGHASTRRKVKAIHRLCYEEPQVRASPLLSRLRTILLAQDLTNLPPVDLCEGHANWQQHPVVASVMTALNEYQQAALKHVLCAPGGIGIITGPPGTGKTHFIVALTKVLTLLGYKVLLCAPSNESTDHLAKSVHAKNPEIGVVRVYRPTAEEQQMKTGVLSEEEDKHVSRSMDVVSTLAQIKGDKMNKMSLKHLSLTARCIEHAPQMRDERAGLEPIRQSKYPKVDVFLEMLRMYQEKQRPSKQLLTESGKQLKEVVKSVLTRASVVVTTCNGGDGKDIRQFYHPDVVIFDEAAQTDEPDTLISMTRECVKAIVLVGDMNQLQPVVVSTRENEFGPQLERSMQSRLLSAGYPSCLLKMQYRMLPEIAEWPNQAFYGGELVNHTSTQFGKRPLAAAFSKCLRDSWGIKRSNRIMVEPHFHEAIAGPNGSLTNYANINLVLSMIKQVVRTTVIKPFQISVIALYELQRLNYVHVLETLRMTDTKLRPIFEGVEVATVDSFQGRENEIVFLDLVTVGGKNGVGFVRDPKRLNVGTTRAKCGLIIVGYAGMCGDRATHNIYKELTFMLSYMRQKDCIVSIGTQEDFTTRILKGGSILHEPRPDPGFEPILPKRDREEGESSKPRLARKARTKVPEQGESSKPRVAPPARAKVHGEGGSIGPRFVPKARAKVPGEGGSYEPVPKASVIVTPQPDEVMEVESVVAIAANPTTVPRPRVKLPSLPDKGKQVERDIDMTGQVTAEGAGPVIGYPDSVMFVDGSEGIVARAGMDKPGRFANNSEQDLMVVSGITDLTLNLSKPGTDDRLEW